MFRRLWISLQRDTRINLRNHFFTVVVLVALVYMAGAKLLVPAESSFKPNLYVVDQTGDGRFAALIQQEVQRGGAESALLMDDPEKLRQRMQENQNSVGLVLSDGSPLPAVTLYFQAHHNSKVRNLMAVSVEDQLRQIYGVPRPAQVAVQTQTLGGQGSTAAVSFSQVLVPMFLFMDAAMLGLLFIAALIFMEKEEGTLMAYLVTPGRVFEYLLSKALTLALLAVLFTLILVPPMIGAGANYLHLIAVMVLASIFTSLLGAWVAVYFDNFTQFLLPDIVLMLVLSLPGVAYLAPSFSPMWLQWLPTYPLVFALREAIFPSGNPQIVYSALLTLLAIDVALLIVSSMVFRRQMARA